MAKKLQLISPLKGEPGDPGVYVGATEPTDPSVQVWVNPSDSEVTAIPAPDTAKVGQTIVVKEVDEDGKPISWECVDAAGGDRWEHICDITTTEDIDAGIEITENSEGISLSELKYNEIWVMAKMVGVDTNTHHWWACWCYPHQIGNNQSSDDKANGASSGGTTGTRYVSWYIFIRGNKMYYSNGSNRDVYCIDGGKDTWNNNYLDYYLYDYFEKVEIVADSTRVIGADTEIRILGRRG